MVHRDVKPENIRVVETDPGEFYIFIMCKCIIDGLLLMLTYGCN